jgi:hypothetical protein
MNLPYPRRARFSWLAGAPAEVIDIFQGWDGAGEVRFFFLGKSQSTPGFVSAVMTLPDNSLGGVWHEPLTTFAAKRTSYRNKRISWPSLSGQTQCTVTMALRGFANGKD